MKNDISDLNFAAWQARNNAYAPYSDYKVGCVVEQEDGKTFWGANVENSIFGLTMCAERNAIYKWLLQDGEVLPIKRLVVSFDAALAAPCGACLQVMLEFMDPEGEVFAYNGKTSKSWKLKELLPSSGVISTLKRRS